MTHQIHLAKYLFTRLSQVGVRSIHGVPGDYNLTVLDYLKPCSLRWVGNANELCAGYAADGYARIKGVGAIMTSFGVGELSAINAIAGAYSEKVPVVHIVGTPPLTAQSAGSCLHHSLGDGNFRAFADMSKSITVARANLVDTSTAPGLIDATLRECVLKSRPVYIELPTDMVRAEVPAPVHPIDFSMTTYNEDMENMTVEIVVARILSCNRPLILVDGFTARYGVQDELNQLAALTAFPTLTTPFGKSTVNEKMNNYHGIYLGSAGDPTYQSWVQDCDLVLHFGPLRSDTNTFGFSAQPNPEVTITFERNSVKVGTAETSTSHQFCCITSVLQKLVARLEKSNIPRPEAYPRAPVLPRLEANNSSTISRHSIVDHQSFWSRMSLFLRSTDIVLTEAGTASYGGLSLALPQGTTLINSSLWLSIGHMLAASQGAALAQREMTEEKTRLPGRTILFEGDGSLQMTAQAISDIIRNKLDVIIFVLNNHGYTIERIIHGFSESYNDIQPWKNLKAASYFGAPTDDVSYPVRTIPVANWGELQDALESPEIQAGKGLNIMEITMGMGDVPEPLRKLAEYVEKRNRGAL